MHGRGESRRGGDEPVRHTARRIHGRFVEGVQSDFTHNCAAMADIVTTVAVINTERGEPGVSVDLNVS